MSMVRTQISLRDEDRSVLDAVSRRTGLSMSALVRDAIHATYGPPSSNERVRAALDTTFGVVEAASGEVLVDALRSGRRLAESA